MLKSSSSPSINPPSLLIFHIDSKHNISPVEIAADRQNCQLKIEKNFEAVSRFRRTSTSPTVSWTCIPRRTKQNSDMLISRLRSNQSSRNRQNENKALSITGMSDLTPKPIPFDKIQELRCSDFDMKTADPQILRKSKAENVFVKDSSSPHQFKTGVILFGKQFNLSKYVFLVIELDSDSNPVSNPNCGTAQWKRWVEGLMTAEEFRSMTYFEKSVLWFKKQIHMAIENKSNHKEYENPAKRSLFRERHFEEVTTKDLEKEFKPTMADLLKLHDTFWCSNIPEIFGVWKRYFLHCSECVDRVFDRQYLRHLEDTDIPVPERDLTLNAALRAPSEYITMLIEIVRNYMEYARGKADKLWPLYIPELDVATFEIKSVIRILVKRMAVQDGSFFQFDEKVLHTNYFLDYLFSEDNTIRNPTSTKQSQDMDRPLSQYWISSSHNTYLTGDQFTSESSIECYVRVLRGGCRCIEIDVWNGTNGKPIVKHGMTLTTSVRLKDVLIAIKVNAFVTTSYPLIISIENHCNLRQQWTMAKYFRKIFGDSLVTETVGKTTSLPSPNQLRNRIIIKGHSLSVPLIAHGQIKTSAKRRIAKDFSDLIVYCKPMSKFDPEELGTEGNNINAMFVKSFDETTATKKFQMNPAFFVWYHQYAMTRIYPRGNRFNSSNPNPCPFWNVGSQMVALNWQTDGKDKPMQWNRGRFKENGNCGYVLKPEPDCMFPGYKGQFLMIKIVSARHLKRQGTGHIFQIVEIDLVGIDADCKKFIFDRVSLDSGLNPYWTGVFTSEVSCPDLALLQFSIYHLDKNDKILLGESTIPVNCIRTGFRSVQLSNSFGEPLLSTLLVNIKKCSNRNVL